ncbi:MAG TPA: hypothetical protein VG148_07060 [Pyrinomonadaceae bacterium]|nr:hypothetical protein [Pyrinomonadaceae bacterium]
MTPRRRKPPRPNRAVRVAAGACVLAAAALAQYYLANVPTPVDVDVTNKFSPAVVRLGQEELVIEEPVSSSAEVLLAHEGRENEAVEVRFDSARLDEQTREDLLSPKFDPPRTPEKIDYTTAEPAAGPPPAGRAGRSSRLSRPTNGRPARFTSTNRSRPGPTAADTSNWKPPARDSR